ncbi:PD-(D/E)XK motif protein [Streptomyces sp. SCSIO 75703]|uniref:PD-(D/E)XK motif protein n=1 Tax=unclassified Streptomyces TaxID=2593676 RepID=UPI000B200AD0|nr:MULTISPECIES: PD-(D/E)XK motif protein [unclassified Streptomyces]
MAADTVDGGSAADATTEPGGRVPVELPWSTVEHYLGSGLATGYRLSAPGEPLVSYEIEDAGRGIALHVELGERHRLPRSTLPAVRVDQVMWRERRFARLTTPDLGLLRDFHDLLLAVAGRLVVEGGSLSRAFDETVHGWSALLGRSPRMSTERRLGLHGELAVLTRLARSVGWRAALDAWVGPSGEEHDFALRDMDLEVKTTASESRRHTIHGLGQLSAAPGRSLWFASLRLTRGGTGGRTLRESVTTTRDDVAAENIALGHRLDRLLAASGWQPEQPDDERWTPRDGPLVLAAPAMPRLTADDLPEKARGRVERVSYVVDVTGLPPTAAPPPVGDLRDLTLP